MWDNVPSDVEITTNQQMKNWLEINEPRLNNITAID